VSLEVAVEMSLVDGTGWCCEIPPSRGNIAIPIVFGPQSETDRLGALQIALVDAIDARMMDVLRQMALESGKGAKEKSVLAFHEAFLSSIRSGGRLNEPMMMVNYKLKSGDLFSDMALGLNMFTKGKLSIFAPKTKDVASVRNIFEKTR